MPSISATSPNPVDVGQDLLITGTDLDTTTRVVFVSRGGRGIASAAPRSASATSVVVTVPLKAKSGIFYLVTGTGNVVGPAVTINDPLGSAQGGQNAPPRNPYVAALARPFQKYVGPASLGTAVAGVGLSANFGEKIAGDFVRGALAVPREVLSAGTKIAQLLVDGVLSVLGPTGAAMSRMLSGIAGGLQKLLENGLSLASKGIGLAGKVVGGGLGAVGAVGGAAVGALFGFPGAFVGAAIGAGIVTGILKAVEGLAGAVAGVLEGVAKTFGIFAEVAGTMIQSLIDIVKDATETAIQKARAILQISQASGFSVGQSSLAVQTGQAFGIGAGQLPRGNAFFAGAMSSLYGGDGSGSPDDLRAYRQMYRSHADQGPIGLMIAQIYESTVGKGAYREAVNYDDATFERQMARANDLEMNPASVKAFGQEFKSLMDTVGMLAENVKVTLAEAFFPILQEGLDAAINYWLENREVIVDTIFEIGKWFYADLPVMMKQGVAQVAVFVANFLDLLSGLASTFFKKVVPFFESLPEKIEKTTAEMKKFADQMVLLGKVLVGVAALGAVGKLARGLGGLGRVGGGLGRGLGRIGSGLRSGLSRIGSGVATRLISGAGYLGSLWGYASGGGLLAGASGGMIAGATAVGAAAGTAVGYGLYRAGQGVGLLDRELSFKERMENGWGRFRDLVTLNNGNYDRVWTKRMAEEAAQKEKQEKEQKNKVVEPKSNGAKAEAKSQSQGEKQSARGAVGSTAVGSTAVGSTAVGSTKEKTERDGKASESKKGGIEKQVANSLSDTASSLRKWAEQMSLSDSQAKAEIEQRRKAYDGMVAPLRDIASSNREIAQNTKPRSAAAGQVVSAQNTLERLVAYIIEDAYLQAGR